MIFPSSGGRNLLPSKKFFIRALSISIVLIGAVLIFGREKIPETASFAYMKQGNAYDIEQTTFGKMSPWQLTTLTEKSQEFPVLINSSALSKTIEYTADDLTVSQDESEAGVESYGIAIANALRPYTLTNLPNEAEAMLNAFETKDINEAGKIIIMAETHKAIVKKLLEITVPVGAQTRHLWLVNNLNRLASAVEDMSKILQSPDVAFFAIGQYKKETNLLPQTLTDLDTYFTEKGVTFKEKLNIQINSIAEN